MLEALPSFAALSPHEQRRISALALELSADVAKWAAPFGDCLKPRLFDNIACIAACAAPDTAPRALRSFVRFSAWLYRLDQILDEGTGSARDRTIASTKAIVEGRKAPRPGDQLEGALAELLASFGSSPVASNVMPEFVATYERMLDANQRLFEASRSVSRGGPLPDVEVFLTESTHDIWHIICCIALLLVIGEALRSEDVVALGPAFLDAALAVRLANDLRTHTKDRAEGRLNILTYGWAPEQVRRHIARHMMRLDQRIDEAIGTGAPAYPLNAVRRVTRVGVEMYAITDLHHDI